MDREPKMWTTCDICGHDALCVWLEDPNTYDGFFCCATLDCEPNNTGDDD